jgi:hypothetical protein
MPASVTKRALLYAALSAGLVLAFFILREHWAHALGLAPYLLLLACPLMHLFHHGHGGHPRHDEPPGAGLRGSSPT